MHVSRLIHDPEFSDIHNSQGYDAQKRWFCVNLFDILIWELGGLFISNKEQFSIAVTPLMSR